MKMQFRHVHTLQSMWHTFIDSVADKSKATVKLFVVTMKCESANIIAIVTGTW